MNRTRYYINVETPHALNEVQKMELLADIRNGMKKTRFSLPDININIGRELTDNDIMENLRETQHIENCLHFDEAQGRHKCVNPVVKSKKCNGVCKNYKAK